MREGKYKKFRSSIKRIVAVLLVSLAKKLMKIPIPKLNLCHYRSLNNAEKLKSTLSVDFFGWRTA